MTKNVLASSYSITAKGTGGTWNSREPTGVPGWFFTDDFNTGLANWSVGANVSIDAGGGVGGSDCAMVTYNASGTTPYVFRRNVATESLSEGHISFAFKVDPAINGGCKFLKIFGKNNGGYANFTLALNYSTGTIYEVSYGLGTTIENDTQAVVRLDGVHTDPSVIVNTSTAPFDPADNTWRTLEFYFKYNTTGLRDGAFKVWVDDVLQLDASNIKNSHDSNVKEVENVGLADYSDSNAATWYLRYDDVVFSRNRIGGV